MSDMNTLVMELIDQVLHPTEVRLPLAVWYLGGCFLATVIAFGIECILITKKGTRHE